MFLVLLRYIRPLADVDRLLDEHRAYLQRQYAAGRFLLSGRMEPRAGGVILAAAESRAAVEAIVAEDPFHRAQAAEYEIVEFVPSMSAPALAHLVAA